MAKGFHLKGADSADCLIDQIRPGLGHAIYARDHNPDGHHNSSDLCDSHAGAAYVLQGVNAGPAQAAAACAAAEDPAPAAA